MMPFSQAGSGGWHSVLVGSRAPRRAFQVTLTREQVEAASPTIAADPGRDPDGYARLLWLARVFRRWPGGSMLALGQVVAEQLRPGGGLYVPAAVLDDHDGVAARLSTLGPVAVAPLLDRLATAGLLARARPHLWRLTVPEHHTLP
jgi:hypothetical protein